MDITNKDNRANYSKPAEYWDAPQLLGFAFNQMQAGKGLMWELGMVFESPDYGFKVMRDIAAWIGGAEMDSQNEIGLSFVIMPDDSYLLYIYPTLNNAKFAEGKTAPPEAIKDQFMVGIICRTFKNYANSEFKKFAARYRNEAYALTAFYPVAGTIDQINGAPTVLKQHVRIKHRSELTSSDFEWHHVTRIIEK